MWRHWPIYFCCWNAADRGPHSFQDRLRFWPSSLDKNNGILVAYFVLIYLLCLYQTMAATELTKQNHNSYLEELEDDGRPPYILSRAEVTPKSYPKKKNDLSFIVICRSSFWGLRELGFSWMRMTCSSSTYGGFYFWYLATHRVQLGVTARGDYAPVSFVWRCKSTNQFGRFTEGTDIFLEMNLINSDK